MSHFSYIKIPYILRQLHVVSNVNLDERLTSILAADTASRFLLLESFGELTELSSARLVKKFGPWSLVVRLCSLYIPLTSDRMNRFTPDHIFEECLEMLLPISSMHTRILVFTYYMRSMDILYKTSHLQRIIKLRNGIIKKKTSAFADIVLLLYCKLDDYNEGHLQKLNLKKFDEILNSISLPAKQELLKSCMNYFMSIGDLNNLKPSVRV
jgi:hypothetical protein